MKQLRLANSIVKMTVKDRIQYPGRLAVDTVSLVARWGLLLLLYWNVYKFKGSEINGVTFPVAAWSMFFYFSLMTLRLRDIAKAIMQDIKTGTVEILFSKPIKYIWYRMWWQFGAGAYSFVIETILGITALVFIVGVPDAIKSWFFVFTLIAVFVLSCLLSLLIYVVVGLLSFWIEDVRPVYMIVDKMVMILGGSFLPVAFFPALMYQIAVWSPFGAAQFVTHTVYDSWSTLWSKMIGIQLLWITVFAVLVFFMFRRAHKRVSVNGG